MVGLFVTNKKHNKNNKKRICMAQMSALRGGEHGNHWGPPWQDLHHGSAVQRDWDHS